MYPTGLEKAAAIMESLIVNHPFIDGNKRIGVLAAITLLLEYSIQLNASEEDLYNFTIKVSTGEAGFEKIVDWLKANTSTL